MYKILFIVKVVEDGDVICGHYRELELPFVPTIGMRFDGGTSTTMWETTNGTEAPKVERIMYHFDEEVIACLFTVRNQLASTFWKDIDDCMGPDCMIRYFFGREAVASQFD